MAEPLGIVATTSHIGIVRNGRRIILEIDWTKTDGLKRLDPRDEVFDGVEDATKPSTVKALNKYIARTRYPGYIETLWNNAWSVLGAYKVKQAADISKIDRNALYWKARTTGCESLYNKKEKSEYQYGGGSWNGDRVPAEIYVAEMLLTEIQLFRIFREQGRSDEAIAAMASIMTLVLKPTKYRQRTKSRNGSNIAAKIKKETAAPYHKEVCDTVDKLTKEGKPKRNIAAIAAKLHKCTPHHIRYIIKKRK